MIKFVIRLIVVGSICWWSDHADGCKTCWKRFTDFETTKWLKVGDEAIQDFLVKRDQ